MSKDNLSPWQKRQADLYMINPLNGFDSDVELVDYNIQEQRYQNCKFCPEFIKLTRQCKLTGSFMDIKTKVKEASCPTGKW